jgi:hypothetical protein
MREMGKEKVEREGERERDYIEPCLVTFTKPLE